MPFESQAPNTDDSRDYENKQRMIIIDHRKTSVSVEPELLTQRILDPSAAEKLRKFEADPKLTRRALGAGVLAIGAAVMYERLHRLFTETGEAKRSPLAAVPDTLIDEIPFTQDESTESVEPIVRESVWKRQAGEIKKGEIIYAPVSDSEGKEKLVSLQFLDEEGQTLLFIDGKKYDQTSRGFPIFVKTITLSEDRKITIEGRAMRLFPGTSTWNSKQISEMFLGLEQDGKFVFTVSTFLGDEKGMIQLHAEVEMTQLEDEVETQEPVKAYK